MAKSKKDKKEEKSEDKKKAASSSKKKKTSSKSKSKSKSSSKKSEDTSKKKKQTSASKKDEKGGEDTAKKKKDAEAKGLGSSGGAGSNGSSDGSVDEEELLRTLKAVKRGDFSARMDIQESGMPSRIADALNAVIDQNEAMCREMSRISDVVGKKGRIDERAALPAASGAWQDCIEAVNELVVDLGQPITEVERVIGAVAKGDLSQTMDLDMEGRPMRGEFLRTGKLVNKMVEQLSAFASEVTRVAREVGTEGKLGGQAEVKGVSGTWKDLTDNVNSMADNLTAQVRNIAEVTVAVANGDLSKKITVEAAGEVADLKNTINTMVDQLSAFASEVTRVAREVGTEGKLGGQAVVPGVSGTWENLTDNVNSMADNLTGQVRNIAEVTVAVANGDLSKKITVEAAGEVAELKDTINTMVDQLSSFADEVTRVAREVGTEGILGGQAEVPGVSGTWEDLTDNVNSMADNLTAQVRGISQVTTAVANGDLSKKITVEAAGEVAELKDTINTMVDQLSSFADEVTRVAREVGTEGQLGGQAEVPGVSGTWKDLTDNVNSMADNLTAQVRNIAEVTTAVANGDLSKKITVDVQGEILELKNTINTMVDQLSSFADEVTRVAREVGTEGILGGQAEVPAVSGTWEDLTDNVNSMANNLTAQVRGISEVTTAVATGDLSKKITVEAAGEVAELKDTINTMVDQLSSFADEVTRVAREVGTEGQLGGQAEVPGVSGTWEDLTDNVNSMANNLTAQVRGIADVTTAVANGDLSKKITVEAAGEVAELKDTINTMVDQLSAFASEVTRVAREVGTEGILGGQAEVPGVSGTWKNLTDNVNIMANNLTTQVRGIADVTTAVANGDLSKKITIDVQGEVLELKDTINTMVDQLSAFASEVTRVAREVGTEGILGGQAEVPGVSGTWKDLTDNVNFMADNLTTQVRGIAKVVTSVARGDLTKKLTVDAKGEIAELANTINGMIETLDTFADQVTTVAREVGVEGQLGGQAYVPGASGTWRDLTDNVNQLAANLTSQVRAITEVTTAVAAGDLTKKITVEAAGEVADLKDNVNEMIRNLKETTRINKEQDWLKTNLTRFTQLLQGQDDLLTVSKVILSELAPLVNVQHGLFYITEDPEDEGQSGEPELKLMASYAHRERKHLANRFQFGEGLIGQCALEKERILVGNVPADYVQINSGLGESQPLNIVVLPVIFEDEVKAVLELASFGKFEDIHLTFLDQLTESIGIVLNTIEANMRTETLLEQSQSLTQELQSRQAELTDTNTRLEQQAESLRESEELLKEQQEELQQTNRELQDKARLLAEQKEEVERKNREIELARSSIEEKAEQLALTSKYKSQFLANMSHELRTPLNSMLILSKMLAENNEKELTPKQVEFAETIHSSGADLLGLINEILDLSKIESGAMGVDVTEVELEDVREDLDRLFGEVAKEKGLHFDIDIDDAVPETITTDSKRLEQVLKNLLSNAIKFTDEGEVVLTVKPAPKDEYFNLESLNEKQSVIAFEVRDTGPGIPEEKQRVIFEAFQQADGTVSRTHGGTGLGLSISREIARLLGGEIHLSSTEGEGSTFTIFLPEEYSPTSLSSSQGGSEDSDDLIDEESKVRMAVKLDEGDGNGGPKYPSFGNGASTVPELAQEAEAERSRRQRAHQADVEQEARVTRQAEEDAARATEGTTPTEIDSELDVESAPDVESAQDTSSGEATPSDEIETPASVEVEKVPDQEADQEEEDRTYQGDGSDQHPTPAEEQGTTMKEKQTGHATEEPFGDVEKIGDDRENIEVDDQVLLIVEDDARFANILKDMANEKGYKCLVSTSAEEGLQLTRRFDIDAITLDVQLPGMHGLTFLDQLKNDPQTRHIPVHIVSVAEELPRNQRRGAMGQLKKPVSKESITESFDRMLGFMSNGKRKLLVVEDNEAQRMSISELVRGEDIEITAVGTAEEALEALEDNGYDCAVIDLGLPDTEGLDLITSIRDQLEMKNLPIVVHTARDLTEKETNELNRLAEAVIVKDIESYDRLLDETALYLHRVESNLSEDKQQRLQEMHKPETSLAGRTIMIVDDDVRNIFAVTSLLERHKMEVVYAESGQEGIEMLNEMDDEIDAVLMDIMMPGMDGYEATRTIRKMPRFKSLPIIAVTAKAMKGDREKCIEAGASDYITKPVNVEQLTSLLRVWLTK